MASEVLYPGAGTRGGGLVRERRRDVLETLGGSQYTALEALFDEEFFGPPAVALVGAAVQPKATGGGALLSGGSAPPVVITPAAPRPAASWWWLPELKRDPEPEPEPEQVVHLLTGAGSTQKPTGGGRISLALSSRGVSLEEHRRERNRRDEEALLVMIAQRWWGTAA